MSYGVRKGVHRNWWLVKIDGDRVIHMETFHLKKEAEAKAEHLNHGGAHTPYGTSWRTNPTRNKKTGRFMKRKR